METIIKNGAAVTITFSKTYDKSEYDPNNNTVYVWTRYEPTISAPVVDKNEKPAHERFAFKIILAHELIHAFHDLRGTTGEGWKEGYKGLDGKQYSCTQDEYDAVFKNDKGSISENDIRAEQGINPRARIPE